MQVNVFAMGKYDTVKIFDDVKKATTYLRRKKKEYFTLMKDVNGDISERAIILDCGKISVYLTKQYD